MGKQNLTVRGTNAGQAAKLLVQQGYEKDEQKLKHKIRHSIVEATNKYQREKCYTVQLPCVESDTTHALHCVDLHCLFQSMAQAAPDFASVLEAALEDNIIRCILYSDEITPGNPLAPDASRKISMFYIMPLCRHASQSEQSWGIVTAIRQRKLRDISGGMPAVLRAILLETQRRCGPHLLELLDKKILVTYQICNIIGDESALHSMLACKGASGRKPCYRCPTILSKQCSKQLGEEMMPDGFFSIAHPSLAGLHQSTDEDIWELLSYLEEQQPNVSKQRFAELQRSIGWTLAPGNLQLEPNLRTSLPPSCFLFDPLHCYFSQGILGTEMTLLVGRLKHNNYPLSSLAAAVSDCSKSFTSLHPPNVTALSDRFFSEETWKANASTQLGLWPLIHWTLQTRLPGHIKEALSAELSSFHALCEELKHINICKHAGTSRGLATLQSIQEKHMLAFVAAYTEECCKPKHHFRLHVIEDYWKRHQLFDCVALERKHRLAKAEIEARGNNLSAVDRCITARLNLIQLDEMKSYRFGFQVVSPDILQHGCFPVRVLTPLCFVEASMLLVPVKWVQTQKGPCALGDVYSMTTQKTGNVILWTSSHQNQLVALNAPWFIPTYWRLEPSIVITIT